MRRRGPLITLLAGLALAGVLITLSLDATRKAQLAAGSANAPAAPDNSAAGNPAEVAPGESGQPSSPPAAGDERQQDKNEDDEVTDENENNDGRDDKGSSAASAANLNVTWAGRVKGGAATIAITAKGDQAIAYVCDGDQIEAWLQGTAAGGKLDLSSVAKSTVDASLTGTFSASRAKGTVTVEGTRFTFDVGKADKPSGLYRASAEVRGARLDGGWIVLADGTQVGLATYAGVTTSIAPLDLDSQTAMVYGERVAARPALPAGAS